MSLYHKGVWALFYQQGGGVWAKNISKRGNSCKIWTPLAYSILQIPTNPQLKSKWKQHSQPIKIASLADTPLYASNERG